MSDYFVMVPRSVRKMLSPTTLAVWISLKDNAEGFSPGLRLLSQDTGLSLATIKRSICLLEECGLLEVVRRSGARNSYNLISTELKSDTLPSSNLAQTELKSDTDRAQILHTTKNKTNNETKNKTNNKPKRSVSSAKSTPTPKKKKPVKKTDLKYEQQDLDFAGEWIEWLSDRGSHHAKSAKKAAYATALGKLRTKYGLDKGKLPEMKKLVLENEFWANNMISPNGLLKTWSNGQIACLALLDELDKVHKKKAPVDDPNHFLAPLVDKIVEADKARTAAYRKAQSEKMRNVTPIRPRLIGS